MTYISFILAIASLLYAMGSTLIQTDDESQAILDAKKTRNDAIEIAKLATTALAYRSGAEVTPEALEQFTKAIRALEALDNPDRLDIDAAIKLLEQGKNEAAKEIFSKIVESSENEILKSAEALRNIGAISFFDEGKESLEAYERSVELDPNSGDAWTQLGHLYIRYSMLDKAKEAYTNALHISNTNEDPELLAMSAGNLGSLYLLSGDIDTAEKFVQVSLEVDKKLNRPCGISDSYNNLGLIRAVQGRKEEAIRYLMEAYEINIQENRQREADKVERSLSKLGVTIHQKLP